LTGVKSAGSVTLVDAASTQVAAVAAARIETARRISTRPGVAWSRAR